MSLTGKMGISAVLANDLAGFDLSTPQESVNQSIKKDIASDKLYHVQLDLADAGTANIDLTDASLTDVFGNTISMITITGIYLKAVATNTTDVTVTTGANAIMGPLPALSAGEGMLFQQDIDVTTNGKLYFSNGAGAAASIDVIIAGDEA